MTDKISQHNNEGINKMFMYRTRQMYSTKIEKIEIKSTTAKFITRLSGVREAKVSEYHAYFDTWVEARDFLLEHIDAEIIKREEALKKLQREKDEILTLKNPENCTKGE